MRTRTIDTPRPRSARSLAVAAGLLLTCVGAVSVAQERTKDKTPPTFEELHAAIAKHYKAGSYGKAMQATRDLTVTIYEKRTAVILGALPAAPEGYEVVPQPKKNNAGLNPITGALVAGVGQVVQQDYKGPNGPLRVTVTADSPMLAMAGMMFENPALLGPDAELIKYDQCKAILKKAGTRWSLQILMDQTMVEANFGRESDEFGLKMFDQTAVTRLFNALQK